MNIILDRNTPSDFSKVVEGKPFILDNILPGKGWIRESTDIKTWRFLDSNGYSLETDLIHYDRYEGVTGEQRLRFIESSHTTVPMGSHLCRYFWDNQEIIPEEFKFRVNNKPTFIFFDGCTISNPNQGYSSLCIFWNGKWCLSFRRRIDVIDYCVSVVMKTDIIL